MRRQPPELVGLPDVCAMLGIGRTMLFDLVREGRIPPPVKVGRLNRWRRAEIRDWTHAGCPPADEWRWTPSVRLKVDDALRMKTEELARLQREIEVLRDLLHRGEQLVSIRR